MTLITAEEALKSRENFNKYIEENANSVIEEILKEYPHRGIRIIMPQLTPTSDNLLEELAKFSSIQKTYLFWFVANDKEWIFQAVKTLNDSLKDNCGVFIVKAFLNDDKIEFECLLKPQIQEKKTRVVNKNTPTKQLQFEYWQAYFEKCDELQSEMQVNPAPRHYQYIGIGKKGVQIMQTINTVEKYVATELFINNDKEIFNKLVEYKNEIEEIFGVLDWQKLEDKKSSRIRRSLGIDISNTQEIETGINFQIQTAEEFKKVFSKYL